MSEREREQNGWIDGRMVGQTDKRKKVNKKTLCAIAIGLFMPASIISISLYRTNIHWTLTNRCMNWCKQHIQHTHANGLIQWILEDTRGITGNAAVCMPHVTFYFNAFYKVMCVYVYVFIWSLEHEAFVQFCVPIQIYTCCSECI